MRHYTDWEGIEQRALFSWAWSVKLVAAIEDERSLMLGEVLTWTPNGVAKLKPHAAAKMRKQGLQAGFPDLVLPLPVGRYHSLYIELKAAKPNDASVTDNQVVWLRRLQRFGSATCVARGWQEASNRIMAYLENRWDG